MKNFVFIFILISMIIFSGCGVSNPIAPDVDTSSNNTLSKSPAPKPKPAPGGGHDKCGCT